MPYSLQERLFGGHMKEPRWLSIIDLNSDSETNSLLYPILPYGKMGSAAAAIGFPSCRYRDIVAYYYQVHIAEDVRYRVIYPTGSIAFSFGLDSGRPEALFFGTATFPREVEFPIPGGDYLVTVFWPYTGYALFRIPSSEFANRSVPLEEMLPGDSESMRERLILSKSFQERIHVIEKFLEERLPLLGRIPNQLLSLIEVIHHDSGYCRSKRIAGYIACSDRHTRRLFLKYIGVPPKLYASVIRHQRTLRALNLNPHQDLAGLAFEQGYYDQSHFIKQFKRFQGSTPVQFVTKYVRTEQQSGIG